MQRDSDALRLDSLETQQLAERTARLARGRTARLDHRRSSELDGFVVKRNTAFRVVPFSSVIVQFLTDVFEHFLAILHRELHLLELYRHR